MLYTNSLLLLFYNEYTLSIIFLNIILYTLLLYGIFASFFYFDLRLVITLSDLKNSNYTGPIITFLILSFLSIAGIPPMLGFSGKLFLFILLFNKSNIFFILFISLFNVFALYFYIRNVRFVASYNPKCVFNIKYNYVFIDSRLPIFLINMFLINVFGFLFSEDIIIYCSNTFSYIF